jgi:hypothetical protein
VQCIYGKALHPNLALPTVSRTSKLDSQKIEEQVMDPSPSPAAYEKTSVLLLGWNKDNDDTEAAGEVRLCRDSPKVISCCTG